MRRALGTLGCCLALLLPLLPATRGVPHRLRRQPPGNGPGRRGAAGTALLCRAAARSCPLPAALCPAAAPAACFALLGATRPLRAPAALASRGACCVLASVSDCRKVGSRGHLSCSCPGPNACRQERQLLGPADLQGSLRVLHDVIPFPLPFFLFPFPFSCSFPLPSFLFFSPCLPPNT